MREYESAFLVHNCMRMFAVKNIQERYCISLFIAVSFDVCPVLCRRILRCHICWSWNSRLIIADEFDEVAGVLFEVLFNLIVCCYIGWGSSVWCAILLISSLPRLCRCSLRWCWEAYMLVRPWLDGRSVISSHRCIGWWYIDSCVLPLFETVVCWCICRCSQHVLVR